LYGNQLRDNTGLRLVSARIFFNFTKIDVKITSLKGDGTGSFFRMFSIYKNDVIYDLYVFNFKTTPRFNVNNDATLNFSYVF